MNNSSSTLTFLLENDISEWKGRRSRKGSKLQNCSSSSRYEGRKKKARLSHLCRTCNRYYSRRDNLRVHQRVHSGEMPYKCQYCNQTFRWMAGHRIHESNHVRDGDSFESPSSFDGNASTASSSTISIESIPQLPEFTSGAKAMDGKQIALVSKSNGPVGPLPYSEEMVSSSPEDPMASWEYPPSVVDMLLTEGPVEIPILQEPWNDLLDDYFGCSTS